jgi:hypothetical protein
MPNAKPKGGHKRDGGANKKNSGGGDRKEVTIDAAALLGAPGMMGFPGLSASPMGGAIPMSGMMGGGPMDSLSLMSMMSGGAVAGATGGAGTINVKMNPMQLMQYNQAMQVQSRVAEQARMDARDKELEAAVAKDREKRGNRSGANHQQVSPTETDDTSDTDQGEQALNRKQRKRIRRRAKKDLKNQEFDDCKAQLEEERKARLLAEAQVEHINQVADMERRALAAEPVGRITRGRALSADNVLLTPGKSSLLEAVDTARAMNKSRMVVTFSDAADKSDALPAETESETSEILPPKPRRERKRHGKLASPASTEVPDMRDQFAALRKAGTKRPAEKKMLTDELRAVMIVMAIKDIATECTEEPAYDKMPKSMGAALKVEAESILHVVSKSKDKRQRITELESGLGVTAFNLERNSREPVVKFMVRVLFAIGMNDLALRDHENWGEVMEDIYE